MAKWLIPLVWPVLVAGWALAHDMWLETQTFIVERPGEPIAIRNGNGTIYQVSENAITLDRIARLAAVDPRGATLVLPTPEVEEPWLNLRLVPEQEGSYWIGLSTRPNKIALTGAEFTEYLEHDGIPNVLRDRREKGISARDEVEEYSKHVKAYLQVGAEHSANFDHPLGLEIEIVPLANPSLIRVGETLPVRVLFRGKPLAELTLHAGFAGQSAERVQTVTDSNGEAGIAIPAAGKWYIRGIHLFQVDHADHSYESYWATLTFQIDR